MDIYFDNEIAKGYLKYAIRLLNENEGKIVISNEIKEKLLNAMEWSFSDKTEKEAQQYYFNH